MNVNNQNTSRKKLRPQVAKKQNLSWLAKGAIAIVVAGMLLNILFHIQPTYNWVYNGLLKQNMKIIDQYPNLNYDQKMAIKLGASYEYLYYVKQQTPPNAVILYPSAEDFRVKGNPFTQEIYNKVFATRFLYPRRLIQRQELSNSPYANKLTHVAIVNGMGLKQLPFSVDSTAQHAVFALQPSKK